MRAWKFLDATGSTVFSRHRWSAPSSRGPGPWVDTAGVDPCRRGIYACRPGDLPYWISDQLFEIELDGDVVELDRKVAAMRGRLVRRIELWSHGVARELMERAGFRTRDLAVAALGRAGRHDEATRLASVETLSSLETVGATLAAELGPETPLGVSVGLASDGAHYALVGEPAQAPFVAACAAGHAADGDATAQKRAVARERARQGAWMAGRLDLT